MHWNPNSFVITEINILIDQNEMIDGLKISIAVLFNKIKLNWIKKKKQLQSFKVGIRPRP